MFHEPDRAGVIVDNLILLMKNKIEENPMLPVGMLGSVLFTILNIKDKF